MKEIVLHHWRGAEWRGKCPQPGCHNIEMHLGVNTSKEVFGCVKCGWGGTLPWLSNAFRLVWVGRQKFVDVPDRPERIDLMELDDDAKGYLIHRGIGLDDWDKWGLKISPDLPFRVVFPWPSGEYWAARAMLSEMVPKYRHPKGRRPDEPYGAWHVTGDTVVVVEGPIDAVKTPDAMAILGHHISDAYASFLNQRFRTKIVYFDPDVPSSEYKSVFKLKGDVRVICCDYPGDPGSRTLEENAAWIEAYSAPIEEVTWIKGEYI